MLYLQTEAKTQKTDSVSEWEPAAVPDFKGTIIKTHSKQDNASPSIKHTPGSPHSLTAVCKGSDDLGGKCSTFQEINCQNKSFKKTYKNIM